MLENIEGIGSMRRIVLASAFIYGSIFSASGQAEQGTIEVMKGPRNTILFVFKPSTNNASCPSIDTTATTPDKAQRMGQTIFAEALVYDKALGYVFFIANANGPHEVYFATYTLRGCSVDENQVHKQRFFGEKRFAEAKAYYHSLLIELLK
jgi:hypothetical protein